MWELYNRGNEKTPALSISSADCRDDCEGGDTLRRCPELGRCRDRDMKPTRILRHGLAPSVPRIQKAPYASLL